MIKAQDKRLPLFRRQTGQRRADIAPLFAPGKGGIGGGGVFVQRIGVGMAGDRKSVV